MALISPTRPSEDRARQVLADLSPTKWIVVEATRAVPLEGKDADRLLTDSPTWTLWDPGIRRVDHQAGERGKPGMLCKLVVGPGRIGVTLHHVLMAHRAAESVVYGGGWRGGRVIDDIRLLPGPSSTRILRRLEIQLCGRWRLLRPIFSILVRRHLQRSLAALA